MLPGNRHPLCLSIRQPAVVNGGTGLAWHLLSTSLCLSPSPHQQAGENVLNIRCRGVFNCFHLWPQISEQQAVLVEPLMKKWSESACAPHFLSTVLIKPFLFLFLLVPLNVIGLALIVTEMCGGTSAAGSGPCQNDLCWHFSHQT